MGPSLLLLTMFACGPSNDLTAADTTTAFQALTIEVGARYIDAWENGGTFEKEVACSGGGTIDFSSDFGEDITNELEAAVAMVKGEVVSIEAGLSDCSDGEITFDGDLEFALDPDTFDPTSGALELDGGVWFESAGIEGSCDLEAEISYDFNIAEFDPSELGQFFEMGPEAEFPIDMNPGVEGDASVSVCGHESVDLAVGMGERFVGALMGGVIEALSELL